MHKKTVVLTENFHSVFRSAAVFPSPKVPPIETTYLTTQYSNAKEKLCCLLKTFTQGSFQK